MTSKYAHQYPVNMAGAVAQLYQCKVAREQVDGRAKPQIKQAKANLDVARQSLLECMDTHSVTIFHHLHGNTSRYIRMLHKQRQRAMTDGDIAQCMESLAAEGAVGAVGNAQVFVEEEATGDLGFEAYVAQLARKQDSLPQFGPTLAGYVCARAKACCAKPYRDIAIAFSHAGPEMDRPACQWDYVEPPDLAAATAAFVEAHRQHTAAKQARTRQLGEVTKVEKAAMRMCDGLLAGTEKRDVTIRVASADAAPGQATPGPGPDPEPDAGVPMDTHTTVAAAGEVDGEPDVIPDAPPGPVAPPAVVAPPAPPSATPAAASSVIPADPTPLYEPHVDVKMTLRRKVTTSRGRPNNKWLRAAIESAVAQVELEGPCTRARVRTFLASDRATQLQQLVLQDYVRLRSVQKTRTKVALDFCRGKRGMQDRKAAGL